MNIGDDLMNNSKKSPKRILVVGDVHGQIKALRNALKSARFNPKKGDFLIMLGDIIDRGYGSKETLDFAIELVKSGHGIVLRGNHEQMALDAYASNTFKHWFDNGGSFCHDQIMGDKRYIKFMESMPLMHTHESFIFVHAGLNPELPITNQDPVDLLWIREQFIINEVAPGSIIIVGHTPVQCIMEKVSEPITYQNKIFMDTGAALGGKGGRVTVMDIHSGNYWQSECIS